MLKIAKVLCAWSVAVAPFAMAKDFSAWTKYTQAEIETETTGLAPGGVGTIGLHIRLSKDWHTYWINPGDSGTPLNLHFKTSPGVHVERVLFPVPQREFSGPLTSFVYNDDVLFPIDVRVDRDVAVGSQAAIQVDAEWLVCADVCIPAVKTFKTTLPVLPLNEIRPTAEFPLFQVARSQSPVKATTTPQFVDGPKAEQVQLNLPPNVAQEEFIDFFPFRGSGVTAHRPDANSGVLTFTKSTAPSAGSERVGVLLIKVPPKGELQAVQFGQSGWDFVTEPEAPPAQLPWMLVFAFVGGLILNLMPCVFPILSMKLLSLLKTAEAHPREVRAQNLAYVVGVLLSFVTVALTLSVLRSAGHLIGWGFQLQSPVFLSGLALLFFALTLNLFGFYEIDLMNAGFGHRLTRFGGLWGSFFTGVLAVIVASPCTAPFMGVALGFGLAQPTLVLVLIFALLGLGLSFPYLLFVVFPGAAQRLPKPGAWMNRVRQIMGLPLLATTIWMLWILAQLRGSSAVFMVMAAGVVLLLALLVRGPSVWQRLRGVVTVMAVVAALWGVHQLAHPSAQALAEGAPEGPWQNFSESRLQSVKGQNVFVHMTADWCLTCKVNERLVFSDPEVRELLRRKQVTWLLGDWTDRNDEITRFLNRYSRVGVPFYVLFSKVDADGTPLPEVLTKSIFMDLINKEYP